MKQLENDDYWRDILEKFSKHKGTIVSFCKSYDVNIHRLYHKRKKFEPKKDTKFHVIDLKKDKEDSPQIIKSYYKPFAEIRIEIGKAKIYISNTDQESVSTIVKEITKNC